jgi:hypothetical protein
MDDDKEKSLFIFSTDAIFHKNIFYLKLVESTDKEPEDMED